MGKINNSLIIVVLNEAKSILPLLDSLYIQTKLPDEAIFIDGGSSDDTINLIKNHKIFNKLTIRIFKKKGNIATGRNEGIRRSSGKVIVFTDAGCILNKDWFVNIISPFNDKKIDVVAGYYRGKYKNIFQKCLIPYVLVMPDNVNPDKFLPSTRSVAIRKSIFKKVGMFRENLNHAEDHEFSRRLIFNNVNIKFQKNAVVSWIPRENIISTFKMFFRYALGDIQAGILRPKVVFIFLRYILFINILILFYLFPSQYLLYLILSLTFLYLYWSIFKNYKYVKKVGAFFYLPLIQITSDIAVMIGSIVGIINITRTNIWGIQSRH